MKTHLLRISLAAICLSPLTSTAALVFATNATSRTLSGPAAANITTTGDGSVTVGPTTAIASTNYQTANSAANILTPNINTDTGGEWQITIPFDLNVTALQIDNITLSGAMYNNTGLAQTVQRDTNIRVSFVGSTSGQLDVGTLLVGNPSGSNQWTSGSYIPSSPLVLSNAETWTFQIETVNRTGPGNFTGLRTFEVNATAVPEPSSTTLLGLAGLSLILRRRR
ncbi:hypothetical protein NT6N_15960 [Oceaniferula spumae]|uniref:Ice-binding protein C-terminal domain-containing protein n=1 Tax=Oceaniferula spumae TaxID=2979115 RepID=A0AAT9FKU5_9BACT